MTTRYDYLSLAIRYVELKSTILLLFQFACPFGFVDFHTHMMEISPFVYAMYSVHSFEKNDFFPFVLLCRGRGIKYLDFDVRNNFYVWKDSKNTVTVITDGHVSYPCAIV